MAIVADSDKIQNGYKIRGIEPADLKGHDPSTRLMYWGWVLTLGLRRKDYELSQGLDKNGSPLKSIEKYTRDHRRSAMTVSGKGDPDAPPLMPAWAKSRTRSLLKGRAFTTHADFFWGYDSYTGDSWGKILDYQAKQGRDVFGISDSGLAWIKAKSRALWDEWKAGNVRATTRYAPEPEVTRQRFPTGRTGNATIDKGRKPTPDATYGIGTEGPRKGHGGRSAGDWDKYFNSLNTPKGGAPATTRATTPRAPRPPVMEMPKIELPKVTFPRARKAPPAPESKPKPPTPLPSPVIPADFAAMVLAAVELVPKDRLQWGDRAWIADVWRAYREMPGALQIGLEEWKERVVNTDSLRFHMVRLDLVQAVEFGKIAESETEYKIGGRVVASYHFFKVTTNQPDWWRAP